MSRRILVCTYPEAGQSATILAVVAELLSRRDPLDIHIASFADFAKKVELLKSQVSGSSSLTFHPITGLNEMDAIFRVLPHDGNQHPPTTRSSYGFELTPFLLCPWSDEEFEETMQDCKSLLLKLKPDLIYMDMAFHQFIDACKSINAPYVVNTCMPQLQLTSGFQPWSKSRWYYPTCASNLPFPVPWLSIPKNIWLSYQWERCFSSDPRAQKASGFAYRTELPYICQGCPELDFPGFIPSNMTLYGPIIAKSAPLDTRGSLAKWLDRTSTVFFNMGTHYDFTDELARIALDGILSAFEGRHMQLLWKIPGAEKFQGLVRSVLSERKLPIEMIQISSWFEASIPSILTHPNIVCAIHHGGANSYFEAAFSGVPQVILPMWFDLYDNAGRAEYLGIGACGNRSTAPKMNSRDLESALKKVITEKSFQEKAAKIGAICRAKEGRARAADFLLSKACDRFSSF